MKLRSRYNHTFSKPYNPYYLALQFDLVQGIPFPYNSFAKFDERANLYANELVDWELSSNKRINNFFFEKFRIAPSTSQKITSWWEVMFKKLLVHLLNTFLLKLRQAGIPAILLASTTPTTIEATGISALTRTGSTKEASALKIKYSSPFASFYVSFLNVYSLLQLHCKNL